MIKYEEDTFTHNWQEIFPLFIAHFHEVGLPGIDDDFDLDIPQLKALEASHLFPCMAARAEDNKIIGYICGFINQHPMFKGKRSAGTLAFYVSPDYRGSFVGLTMVKEFEKLLRIKYNVDWFDLPVSANQNLDAWAKRLGFVKSDIVYRKKL